jgi:hypothetical protein
MKPTERLRMTAGGVFPIGAKIRIDQPKKDSPQSAQRPHRKTLLLARTEVRVPSLLTHSFFRSALRALCDLCGEILIGVSFKRP